MLIKEFKEELHTYIDVTFINKTQPIKISVLPKWIYKFNTISIKIPATVFIQTKLF